MARPRNETQAEIRKELGVKERQARRLEQQGVTGEKLTELTKEKIRKLKIEIATQEAKLAKFKREVVTKEEVDEQGRRLAEIQNGFFTEALTDWPTQLAGKDERQVREILLRKISGVKSYFQKAIDEF